MADDRDTLELPPPPMEGAEHTPEEEGRVVEHVLGLMLEGYEERQQYDDQADRNTEGYLGWVASMCDRFKKLGVDAVQLNRIRNVLIAHVQVQTEQTPHIKLIPRETAEEPRAYLNLSADVGNPAANVQLQQLLASKVDPAAWKPEPTLDPITMDPITPPPRPLTAEERVAVEQAIAQGVLPPDALTLITDRVRAEAIQTVFDVMWDACGADFYVGEAIFNKTCVGWAFPLYGFDDTKKQHTLDNFSHLQIFVDPDCTNIEKAAHAEILQFIPFQVAKRLYPKHAERFAAYATDGPQRANLYPFRMPRRYQRTNFQRRFVEIVHCWIRDWPFPMDRDDAIAGGQVIEREAAAESVVGGEGAGGHESMEEMLAEGEQTAQAAPRMICCDPESGAEIAPGHAKWPVRLGLREIVIIGNVKVFDGESQFCDIPLPHLVNLPIPDSPFGQGEPETLEPLQTLLDALLTDISTHFHFFGTPTMAMPVSVAQKLPGFAEGVYSSPVGQVWEIPDELIKQLGGIENVVGFIDPPALPPDYFKLVQLLIDLIDKQGQVTEAMQGEGKANWSGDLVARLQEASRALIIWKSKRVEVALRHLARLMIHSILTRLSLADLTRICSKYPAHIWAAIKADLQAVGVDTEAQIASGTGANKEKTKSDSMALYAAKALSRTSLLEDFDRDPKQESANEAKEMEQAAEAQAKLQSTMQSPPAPGPMPPSPPTVGAVGGVPGASVPAAA